MQDAGWLWRSHNQGELDKARAELAVTKAALASAGGEQREAIEAERAQLAAKVVTLEASLRESVARAEADHELLAGQIISLQESLAQANADANETGKSSAGADLGPLRSRISALEGELAAAHGAGQIQAAQREQAEQLLILLRAKYGDLQFELERTVEALPKVRRDTGKTAALEEQVVELKSENVLLEQERERLATRIEEFELLNRDRVQAESRIALGEDFEVPTRPYAMKELQAQAVPTNPNAQRPNTGELELLDTSDGVQTAGDAEEILLLDEEATDPNRKKPL